MSKNKRGKQGEPAAPVKMEAGKGISTPKVGGARGSRPTHLTEQQKVLMVNGGLMHRHRNAKLGYSAAPKQRKSREDKREQ